MKERFIHFRLTGRVSASFTYLLILLLLAVNPGIIFAQEHTKVTRDTYTSGEINGYWKFLPQNYGDNSNQSYPLIVYLHGNSGTGNGTSSALNVMLKTGLTRVIDQGYPMVFSVAGRERTFIALSPQKSGNDANWNSQDVAAFLDHAVATYRVDPARIYLVGYSMGGRGVYEFLADEAIREQTHKLAGAVIVAGSFKEEGACPIAGADIPLLHYHSMHDNTATVTYSSAVTLLQKVNNCQTAFTPELITLDKDPNGVPIDHDAADTISFNPRNSTQAPPNLYKWLLKYELNSGKVTVANFPPEVNAGLDMDVMLPQESLILSGSANDPDGNVVAYLWKQTSGPAGPTMENYNSAEVTIRNLRPGDYLFRLIATDDRNDEGSDEVAIHVEGVVSGVDDLEEAEAVSYPNPFENDIFLEIESTQLTGNSQPVITCTDMAGRGYTVLYSVQSVNNTVWILRLTPDVPEGAYIITVSADDYSKTFRMLKK